MRRYRYFNGAWHYCGLRTIQKSIRISEEVYDYIMTYEGNSFSDKLNSLIEAQIDKTGSM